MLAPFELNRPEVPIRERFSPQKRKTRRRAGPPDASAVQNWVTWTSVQGPPQKCRRVELVLEGRREVSRGPGQVFG